jgi:starch phosphorylase
MWTDLWPDRDVEQIPIGSITNGVHLATWVAQPIASLYARHVGEDWTDALDSFHWRGVDDIPDQDLWAARSGQRRQLIELLRQRLHQGRGRTRYIDGDGLDPDALTIVFARRFATYKRATLLLSDPARLAALVGGERPVQFVFAGKAHPADEQGKALLRQIALYAERPELEGRFLFLEEYDVELARSLVQGADIWLNVPLKPREASGTSGMKAAANGALNLSIADGWWAEAWHDHNRLPDPVGWNVDAGTVPDEVRNHADAELVYRILEQDAVPLYYDRDAAGRPHGWLGRVRAAMRQLPPFFNTHRMVREYVRDSYMAAAGRPAISAAKVDVERTGA